MRRRGSVQDDHAHKRRELVQHERPDVLAGAAGCGRVDPLLVFAIARRPAAAHCASVILDDADVKFSGDAAASRRR